MQPLRVRLDTVSRQFKVLQVNYEFDALLRCHVLVHVNYFIQDSSHVENFMALNEFSVLDSCKVQHVIDYEPQKLRAAALDSMHLLHVVENAGQLIERSELASPFSYWALWCIFGYKLNETLDLLNNHRAKLQKREEEVILVGNRVQRVPHLVGHSGVDQLKVVVFLFCFVVQHLLRYVLDLQ